MQTNIKFKNLKIIFEQKKILNIKTLYFLFFLSILFCLLINIPTSSQFFDEGWAADIGNNISEGDTLYKDISAPYGPVVFYLYSTIISIFGKQFVYFRIVGLFIIILQSLYASKIVALFTKNKNLIVFTAILSIISLGTYQGARITASSVSALITLMIVFYHLSYLFKNKIWRLCLIGGLLAISLLTKHNVFVMDALGNGILIIINLIIGSFKSNKIKFEYLVIIVFSFLLVFFFYVLSIYAYYDCVIKDTILSVFNYHGSDIGVTYPSPMDLISSTYLEILYSVFLYSIFPLILSASFILHHSIKHNKSFLLTFSFLIAMTLLHYCLVYPLSDYSHYVRATVLYPVCFVLMLLYMYKNKYYGTSVLLFCSLIVHLYIVPVNMYSSLKKLVKSETSDLPYHKFIVKSHDELDILSLLNEISELSYEEELLVIGHANFLYYLSDKSSIFRSSMITHQYLDEDDQRDIIEELKKHEVPLIIEAPPVRKYRDLEQLEVLNSYVKLNYVQYREVNKYIIWRKV